MHMMNDILRMLNDKYELFILPEQRLESRQGYSSCDFKVASSIATSVDTIAERARKFEPERTVRDNKDSD